MGIEVLLVLRIFAVLSVREKCCYESFNAVEMWMSVHIFCLYSHPCVLILHFTVESIITAHFFFMSVNHLHSSVGMRQRVGCMFCSPSVLSGNSWSYINIRLFLC